MAADTDKPVVGDNLAAALAYIRDNTQGLAQMFEGLTPTGVRTNDKRFDSGQFQYRTAGGAWAELPITKVGGGTLLTLGGTGSPAARIPHASSAVWALDLHKTDTASSSRVMNGGGYWSFEHVPRVGSSVIWHAGNDGAGSGLDADLLDGQDSSYYTNIIARLGYTPLNSASYTAADVLSKLTGVDGAGSGLDADLLDGNQATRFLTRDTDSWNTDAAGISRFYFNSTGNLHLRAPSGSAVHFRIDNTDVVTSTAAGTSVVGTLQSSGLLYGRGGGAGLGQITVSAAAPSGGADGDLWFQTA